MKRIYIFLLLLCLINLRTYAQPKRTIIQTTSHETVFSVPEKTDMKLITDFDLVSMLIQNRLKTKEITLSKDNYIKITEVNEIDVDPKIFPSDYEYGFKTIVTDESGSYFYNYAGKLIQYTPFESDDDRKSFILNKENEEEYGLLTDFFLWDINKMAKIFISEGYSVKIDANNNVLKARSDNVETYIDYNNLFYEMYFYEKDSLLSAIALYYEKYDKYLIPKAEMECRFKYSENGVKLQRNEITTYLKYVVMEYDKPIVEWASDIALEDYKPKSSLSVYEYENFDTQDDYFKVYPNPAQHQITLDIPDYYEGNITIQISDINGKIIFMEAGMSRELSSINISDLPSGIYIITCQNEAYRHSVKFLKN